MNKKFDVYLDDPDHRYESVKQVPVVEIQKILAQCPGRIHLGRDARTSLQNKQILIQASLTDSTTAEQTAQLKSDLQERYKLSKQTIYALDYRKAGALRAFLGLAELLKNNSALLHAIADYAAVGINGRWQIEESYLTLVRNELRASYVVAWAA
jgi:hypothetical protein